MNHKFGNVNSSIAQSGAGNSTTPEAEAALAASYIDNLDEAGGDGESQTAIETNHTEEEAPSWASSSTEGEGQAQDEGQAQAQGAAVSATAKKGEPKKRANAAEEKKRVLAEYREKEGSPFLVLERTCDVPVTRVKKYLAEALMDPKFPRFDLKFDAELFKNLPASLQQILRAASGSDLAPDALIKLEPKEQERTVLLSVFEL